MNTPHPFNLKTGPLLQVGPVGMNGNDNLPFPCQGRVDVEERTSVTAGDNVFVTFTIGAAHRGGSCQFTVTYERDLERADPTKWKVIYTIIGGCPAKPSPDRA